MSEEDKYESFLGSPGFFDRQEIMALSGNSRFKEPMKQKIFEELEKQLKQLNYNYFDTRPVCSLYDLLFASANSLGLKFWRDSQKYAPNGQLNLGL